MKASRVTIPFEGILRWTIATLMSLLIVGWEARPVAADNWLLTTAMNSARFGHTETLLVDGRVLVTGGHNGTAVLSNAEIYNPVTETWSVLPAMNAVRLWHTATLLADGRILVTGGFGGGATVTGGAQIYDPSTTSWFAVPNMSVPRYGHTATLLSDGRVLVTGGYNYLNNTLASAEIYDPGTNSWSNGASMPTANYFHSAVLLMDGRVLVSGGIVFNAQVYNPSANTWSSAGTQFSTGTFRIARLLSDGRVITTGGYGCSLPCSTEGPLSRAEIYNPLTNIWSTVASMSVARSHHGATILSDGRVLVVGGYTTGNVPLASAEIFNPAMNNWSPAPLMSTARTERPSTTLLSDGRVLVAGGHTSTGTLASAEIFSAQANQNVAFGSLANKTYGDPPFTVSATASSGLPVTFSSVGSCSVAGNTVTINQAGSCTITANQSGNIFWNPAPAVSQSFTIFKATPLVTWSNPATIVYGTPLSGTQLNATASIAGNFVYTPAAGTILNAGNGQTLHVDFTPTDTLNYSGASKDVSINVVLAKPIIEWNNPESIEYGTPLSAVQLNAMADVPGTFTYTPPAGTVLNAGMEQILQVTFQPDNPNYTGKSASVSINVYKSAPKLQITSPSSGKAGQQVNEGDPPITATAASNSDGAITFTAGPPEVCTSNGPGGSTITIVGLGSCTVTATQEESANYSGGSVSFSFYINGRPMANVGPDQTVNENALVILNGLASNDPENDDLTYTWTQVAGTAVTLDNPTAAQSTFTAPSLTYLQDGSVLTFQLIVNDGQLNSLPAVVNVTVKNLNTVPVALASTFAATVNEGSPGVGLKGSDSYDPDGESLSYAWTQVNNGAPAVSLSDPSVANPTFNAPLVGQTGAMLTFQVKVTDPLGASATDTIHIQVANVNQAPTANAGTNQTVNENTLVTLDGTASSDPDNDALGFSWSQVSGSPVALSTSNIGKPTFTAPAVSLGGETLRFKLTVNDGLLNSGESYVNVLVQNVNDPPVCSAARPNLAVLWPPNHKMIPISILGVTDPNNTQVAISITGVTQDEPVSGLGDGDTSPDAVVQGGQLLLRAERAGNGNGRVYRVTFNAADGQGGACGGFVTVSVPRDMKPGNAAVDSGQAHNSTLP